MRKAMWVRLLACAAMLAACHAAAQDNYPSKAVKIVIGFGPGSEEALAKIVDAELK